MNPEQWLSLKWNGGSTMSDRWLNQSKIIHLCILAVFFKRQKEYRLLNIAKTYHNVYSILLLYKFCIKNRDTL